jgi:hypothetical protein
MGASQPAFEPSRERTDAQFEHIRETFAKPRPGPQVFIERLEEGDGNLGYIYEKDVILVHDADVQRVRTVLARVRSAGDEAQPTYPVNGLTRLSVGDAHVDGPKVPAVLGMIDRALGVGVATPNHVLSVTGPPKPVTTCQGSEPEPVPPGAAPDPDVCPTGRDGDGVLVHVVDTGLVPGAAQSHAWLHGVDGDDDPVNNQQIRSYTGHGTFIAGVLRCMAPATQVFVQGGFVRAGAMLELDLAGQLEMALDAGADVISMSAGALTRLDLPMFGFDIFWRQRLRYHKGVVLVAAASNNGDRRPFWPAAFKTVVAVGALAANYRSRASFSDFGGWVDVYAPGEALVNAFAEGNFTCIEPPHKNERRVFKGMARWSGTSFSTPLVAGLIAARMSRTGENGREAAKALLATAHAQHLPGVGATLLPCLDDNDPCDHGHAKHRCCEHHHAHRGR